MEEKDNPRPDSASLRHLNEVCGVKQECAWAPSDMRALKLILIDGEQVGAGGAKVKFRPKIHSQLRWILGGKAVAQNRMCASLTLCVRRSYRHVCVYLSHRA